MIVEYKLNINDNGVVIHPAYIKDHAFYDEVSKTYLGYILPEEKREYWVPDTLNILSEQQVVDRCLAGKVSRSISPTVTKMTDSEFEKYVRQWYNKVRT